MTTLLEAERGLAAAGDRGGRPAALLRSTWGVAVTLVVAAVVAAPVIAVFSHAGEPTGGLWQHLADTGRIVPGPLQQGHGSSHPRQGNRGGGSGRTAADDQHVTLEAQQLHESVPR